MKKQISENILDIVQLIEKNPITRLNKTYEHKFIQKIKNNFTESQQQMFAASFYSYLNYNSKTDFIIDIDLVWKWLGFDRKGKCKELLVKHFTIDIDYKIALPQMGKRKNAIQKNSKNNEHKIITQKDSKIAAFPIGEAAFTTHNLGSSGLNENLSQIKDTTGFSALGEKPQIVTNLGGAGLNKEQILLNTHTFKRLCLKSNAKKADEVFQEILNLKCFQNFSLNIIFL
jgi:hypothetical protein